MSYDALIVGAGFAGAVCARRIADDHGLRVLALDRRHVAGTAHDAVNEAGLLCHSYGPHTFATDSDRVVNYLSRFTGWRRYAHCTVEADAPAGCRHGVRCHDAAFQLMPAGGYTALIERMLDYPQIEVQTGVGYDEVSALTVVPQIVWTGPIDAFFGYRFGMLPWEQVRCEFETVASPNGELAQSRPDVCFVGRQARYRDLGIGQTVASSLQAMDRWTALGLAAVAAMSLGAPPESVLS